MEKANCSWRASLVVRRAGVETVSQVHVDQRHALWDWTPTGSLRACASPLSLALSRFAARTQPGAQHSCRMPADAAGPRLPALPTGQRKRVSPPARKRAGLAPQGAGGEGKVLHWAISTHPFARSRVPPASGRPPVIVELPK